MESSSDVETDISESEREEYEAEVYINLKEAGPRRVKYPNGSFRCPFCPGKKKREYIYSDLLRHAVACGSTSPRSPRDRASHLALAKLLRSDYQPGGPCFPTPHPLPEDAPISAETDVPIAAEDRFVFPWFGVLANLSTWIDSATERLVGESGRTIKEKLALNGLHSLRVRPVYAESNACRSHSGYALVAFASGWNGFAEAIAFKRHFDKNARGKRDWVQNDNVGPKGTVYGWITMEEDYFHDGPIGEQLRKNGDLRTLAEVARAESKKTDLLVKELVDQIAAKDKLLEELGVTGDWKAVLVEMMKERDELRHALGKGYSGHFGTEFQSKQLEDPTVIDKFSTLSFGNDELQQETTAEMNHNLDIEQFRRKLMPNESGEDDTELTKTTELNEEPGKLRVDTITALPLEL